jgi:propanol-preferring alcohol dehydrogenase
VQILQATTAAQVIAVDTRPEALALASDCGAEITLASGADTASEIREQSKGRGADLVLDFVGSDDTMALGAAVVRSAGDLTIVGIAGGSLPVSFFSVPYETSIQTTYWGSRPELVEVLELAAAGLLRPKITTLGLDAAIDAYRAMQNGKLEGRAVIVPSPA